MGGGSKLITLITTIVVLLIPNSSSFIIPDEIPSLLSVIYSNIPVIKKGTDSRLGWGFRLSDRADFQVLVELGPQTYTQPLANQGDNAGNRKRQNLDNLSNSLYALRQEEKRQRIAQAQNSHDDIATNQSDGGAKKSWLEEWRESMGGEAKKEVTVEQLRQVLALSKKVKPGLAVGEIDAKSVIPPDAEVDDGRQPKVLVQNDNEQQVTTEISSTGTKES